MFNRSAIHSPLKRIFLTTALFVAVTAVSLIGARDAKAIAVDLGFALDESGSVGQTNFTLMQNGLADALGLIPVVGPDQYTVSVVTFDTNTIVIVPPTLVTAASIAGIQNAVKSANFNGGGTNIAAGIDRIVSQFGKTLGDKSLINVSTDGQSNTAAFIQAANDAKAAGWDGLSFEAIGTGTADSEMAKATFPGVSPGVILPSGSTPPDPSIQGFVLKVAGFADYKAAIASKISAIVKPPPSVVPVPAAVWLFGTALIGFIGVSRRRKVS